MKYTMVMAVVGKALDAMIKREIPETQVRKAIRQEYRAVMQRASDIVLPKDMIDTITLDLDGMPIGTVITVADLPELQNPALDLQVPADEIVLRIVEKKNLSEAASDEEE